MSPVPVFVPVGLLAKPRSAHGYVWCALAGEDGDGRDGAGSAARPLRCVPVSVGSLAKPRSAHGYVWCALAGEDGDGRDGAGSAA